MDLGFTPLVPDDDAATAPDALSPAERAAIGAALRGRGGSARAMPALIAGAFNPAMAARLRDWFRQTAGRAGGGIP